MEESLPKNMLSGDKVKLRSSFVELNELDDNSLLWNAVSVNKQQRLASADEGAVEVELVFEIHKDNNGYIIQTKTSSSL